MVPGDQGPFDRPPVLTPSIHRITCLSETVDGLALKGTSAGCFTEVPRAWKRTWQPEVLAGIGLHPVVVRRTARKSPPKGLHESVGKDADPATFDLDSAGCKQAEGFRVSFAFFFEDPGRKCLRRIIV